ncbi:ef hand family protein [Chrysochromulina tobinii]|uniref:Ef hand family protein n=1 Tax=Chrysochromulina tobinii TaxID=1460289 RepID=A0A0M0KZG4_9EUKA|nr:ef hand family protein [Chrysochromulina tobinii]|eukprot:KOO44199.1 ef hand family protein [Chrysochromulina sp. CCMP291]
MPGVPTSEEVTAYLAAHKLEPVIEDAVNDAVLKQVKNPFWHIAQILLKKSEEVGEAKSGTRVSLDGAVKESPVKRPAFAPEAVVIGGGRGQEIDEAGLTHTFTKSEGTLTDVLQAKLKSFFDKMDLDSNGEVSKEEAEKFWGKNFAKLNAQSMFNEVDEDGNGTITWVEFLDFWKNVAANGYSQEDLEEEVQMMMEGGSWVDFDDGRTT